MDIPCDVTWYVLVLFQVGLLQWDDCELRNSEGQRSVVRLLTGACVHVTGVALGAAVLMVLTAHRLHQRTAAPGPCGELTAGRSRGTAALVITLHVCYSAGLIEGAQFGKPGNHMWPSGAGGTVRLTGVTTGATVISIIAANRMRNRATAPLLSVLHEAAGGVPGAAGAVVTHIPA